MSLTPELMALKARCHQALSMGATLAHVESHLASLGAVPAPAGVSPEQHLLDVLLAMEAGTFRKVEAAKPAKVTPKVEAPPPPPPTPTPSELAAEPAETPKVEEPVAAPVEPEVKKGKKGR